MNALSESNVMFLVCYLFVVISIAVCAVRHTFSGILCLFGLQSTKGCGLVLASKGKGGIMHAIKRLIIITTWVNIPGRSDYAVIRHCFRNRHAGSPQCGRQCQP